MPAMDICSAKADTFVTFHIPPVIDLSHLEALPPASRSRELKKAADTFASTGRNLFVHYATPVLVKRRELLLASGSTKKKYPKTPAQLWPTLDADDTFFWNQAAKVVRLCMKEGSLSTTDCLIHAGRVSERQLYLSQAEIAVAKCLNTPPPQVMQEASAFEMPELILHLLPEKPEMAIAITADDDPATACPDSEPTPTPVPEDPSDTPLLDTTPLRFSYQPNMLYSHFANYDYDEVRKAEGKHQTAMLRQLANLFDKTGKTLFYYYTVPRLCQQVYPPSKGETVTAQAAGLWRFLAGREKEKWCLASARLKKTLGDGDIAGLEVLQLDGAEPEVFRLHEMAMEAVGGCQAVANGNEVVTE